MRMVVNLTRYFLLFRSAGLLFSVLLSSCAGYLPGQKTYWDNKLKEMCANDGGVHIFEKLYLSKAEALVMRRRDGQLDVLLKDLAPANAPAFAVMKREFLRRGNPEATRVEVSIVRRRDQALLAKWVAYGRFGGDFPSYAHPSSFGCPSPENIARELQEVFAVEE